MATHASGADSDTVPDGDEDNKVCEEEMRLMAGPQSPTDHRTCWWWGVPKGEARRVELAMETKADILSIRVISQERAPHSSCLSLWKKKRN